MKAGPSLRHTGGAGRSAIIAEVGTIPERKPTMGEILEALRCVERIDVGKFDHPELARISVANLIAELTAAMLDGANRNG